MLGAIDVLEDFLHPLGAQTIVPGHGPVGGPETIDDVLAYLRFVRDLARDGDAVGATPLDLARETDLGAFADCTDTERIVGNLHRAFQDLTVRRRIAVYLSTSPPYKTWSPTTAGSR